MEHSDFGLRPILFTDVRLLGLAISGDMNMRCDIFVSERVIN